MYMGINFNAPSPFVMFLTCKLIKKAGKQKKNFSSFLERIL